MFQSEDILRKKRMKEKEEKTKRERETS